MPNRKLLEVVRLLAPEQSKRLRLFLQSPYFNNGYNAGQIVELFDLTLRCKADEQHPELSKEAASRRFFPEKPFREKEKNPIDSLASDLFRLVRRFILLEDAEGDLAEDREQLALARFYLKNNLDERFEQTIQSLRKTLATSPFRDAQHYLRRFETEELVATFQGIFNTFEDDANLMAAHRDLDTFFAIQKLEFACALDFQRFVSQVETGDSTAMTQSLLMLLSENPHLQVPMTRLYAHILSMLDGQTTAEALEILGRLLDEHRHEIPAEKFRNLQAYYRFFMGRQYVKEGGPNVLSRFFELNERHLRDGYFYVMDDRIHTTSLRLMVNIALKVGKADWASKFLAGHPPSRIIGTRYPEETHSLCMADVHFFKKDYDSALKCLDYKLFENAKYRIMADVLLVKIYFETNDDLLESRLKALDQKVRRSKLSAESKLPYLNFIQKLDKIVKASWQKDTPKTAKLADEIRQMPAVLEREWLLAILGQ